MEGMFYFDGRLFRIVEKVINLIKLNVLFVVFSLPLVTGGGGSLRPSCYGCKDIKE